MNQLSVYVRWMIFSFFLIGLGCGPTTLPTHPIRGQLEYPDGSTPSFGTVEFFNAENRINARGKVAADGSFTVGTYSAGDGAVLGNHSVIIFQLASNHLTAQKKENVVEVEEDGTVQGHDHEHDAAPMLHRKYNDYRTSELKFDVQPGENNIKFVLDPQPQGR